MIHLGIGELCSLGCALLWAIAVVLLKKSGESLAPFALNLFKNALVLPLFLATIALLQGPALPAIAPADVALALLSGLLGIAAGDTLYFRALNSIGASRMAVAQTLYSPFVIVLSMLVLHETLRPLQFAGVGAVLGGIALVTWSRGDDGLAPGVLLRGAAFGGFSVLLMAIGVVIAKPLLERHDFLWIVTLRVAGGFGGMLLIAIARGLGPRLLGEYRRVRHWPHILAGALFGTYLSMMAWLAGYKYTKASIAAVLNELAAVFIVLLAVLFLRERVSRRQVLGTVVAVAGVLLVVAS
jgi:drug/metabolite transporter (DMT)-like permease